MDSLWPVAGFVTVAAITPGPNNFIVLTTAARAGLFAALPSIAGVVAGSLAMLVLVWAGAGPLLESVPPLRVFLVAAGALYLVWLGVVSIRRAARTESEPGQARERALPGTALGMAAFQFLNPKGWMLVLTATAAMSQTRAGVAGLAGLAATFVVVFGACSTLWACAGAAIVDRLERPGFRRAFERAMGGLLIASAVLLFA